MPGLQICQTLGEQPSNEIKNALRELEALGLVIEETKGRSAHSWGFCALSEEYAKRLQILRFLPDVDLEYADQSSKPRP